MIIQLTTIPKQGLQFESHILFEELNKRMNEGKDNDIEFTKNAKIELLVKEETVGYSLTGVLASKYKQPCGRCIELKEVELNINVYLMLIEGDENETEEGILYFQGFNVNIRNYIEELIILNLSPYLLPKIDAANKCELCLEPCEENGSDIKTINKQKPFADLKKLLH